MIAATRIYYDGDLIVEMPPSGKLSLDIKNRTPRANILVEKVLKYSVTVSASEGGSATGGGAFDLGDQVTVIATPDATCIFDGWYSNGTKVSSLASYTFTVVGDTVLQAKFISMLADIGGRIYYVDSTASGGIYHFYDANGNELTTQTVSGLANATKYYIESPASKAKFYVYATEDGKPTSNIYVSESLKWNDTSVATVEGTTDSRGSGINNSELAINALGTKSDTIWNWLRNLRISKFNGNNDWFIGSKVELDDIRNGSTSGKSIFNNAIWSSVVAVDAINVYSWNPSSSKWVEYAANSSRISIPLRSF